MNRQTEKVKDDKGGDAREAWSDLTPTHQLLEVVSD